MSDMALILGALIAHGLTSAQQQMLETLMPESQLNPIFDQAERVFFNRPKSEAERADDTAFWNNLWASEGKVNPRSILAVMEGANELR